VLPAAVRPGNLDDSTAIVELLVSAVGGRGPRLDETAHRYRHDPAVKTLVAVIDTQIAGFVGFVVGDTEVTLLHIATTEPLRRRGIGAQLPAAVEQSVDHRLPLTAETDRASIGFYQALGFTIESLGHKYPGVERFTVRRFQSGAFRRG
jgi:ribosomal protein S18 acetylase RimI-like enzyme